MPHKMMMTPMTTDKTSTISSEAATTTNSTLATLQLCKTHKTIAQLYKYCSIGKQANKEQIL